MNACKSWNNKLYIQCRTRGTYSVGLRGTYSVGLRGERKVGRRRRMHQEGGGGKERETGTTNQFFSLGRVFREPFASRSCTSPFSSSCDPSQTCMLAGLQWLTHLSTYSLTFGGRSSGFRLVGTSISNQEKAIAGQKEKGRNEGEVRAHNNKI